MDDLFGAFDRLPVSEAARAEMNELATDFELLLGHREPARQHAEGGVVEVPMIEAENNTGAMAVQGLLMQDSVQCSTLFAALGPQRLASLLQWPLLLLSPSESAQYRERMDHFCSLRHKYLGMAVERPLAYWMNEFQRVCLDVEMSYREAPLQINAATLRVMLLHFGDGFFGYVLLAFKPGTEQLVEVPAPQPAPVHNDEGDEAQLFRVGGPAVPTVQRIAPQTSYTFYNCFVVPSVQRAAAD